MAAEWPLIGRSEEFRLSAGLLRNRDRAGGVVLAGAAGVGKTRLAAELLADAGARGARVRWVPATASARILPLGAFRAVAATVDVEPARLLDRVSRALVDGAGPAGAVVGVDDGHLLDELSATLVHQLVLSQAATVVLTIRSGERAPDAVTALWKERHLQRLELQPLGESEAAELLAAALGGLVDNGSARRLWSITQGNPLYLRALVEGEQAAGRLRTEHDVWRWTGEPRLSPGLSDLIGDRIGALSEGEREVIDLLAYGEPLEVDLLADLTDPDSVERCENRGLIRVETRGSAPGVRLAHPLYGEVQRIRCGELRARRLRGRLARALPESGRDTMRRALLVLGSDLDHDPGLLTAACRIASQLPDLALAERFGRAAVAAGGGIDSRLGLARVLSFAGKGAETEQLLAELTKSPIPDDKHVDAVITRAANIFWVLGSPEAAEDILDTAGGQVRDPAARSSLAAMRAAIEAGVGRPAAAVEAAQAALADPTLPGLESLLATMGLTVGLGAQGKADQIGHAAARCHQSSSTLSEAGIPRLSLSHDHVVVLGLAGYLHDAERIARDRLAECAHLFGPERMLAVVQAGAAALAVGRATAARDMLIEARAALRTMPIPGWRFLCALHLAEAFAVTGDAAGATANVAELAAVRHPAFGWHEPSVMVARAWATAATGSVNAAAALARDAAAVAAQAGQFAHEVLALHTAARFGDRTVAGRLTSLAATTDGPRAPAAAMHAAALADDDGDGLLAASERFEEMGALLHAADAAAHAADAHSRYGRRGAALTAAARARRFAENCPGALTPALRALAMPPALTRREREIATLVAAGLSNRDIADRIGVSVRTIEGHLYRIYRKLGVTSRVEIGLIIRD